MITPLPAARCHGHQAPSAQVPLPGIAVDGVDEMGESGEPVPNGPGGLMMILEPWPAMPGGIWGALDQPRTPLPP